MCSKFQEGDAGRQSAPLPLPPSGLPHSARSVVVYKKGQYISQFTFFSSLSINTLGRVRPPGLLVVSGEGVARHWPSIESSVHDEAVIDLASEVTLSVQLLDLSARSKLTKLKYIESMLVLQFYPYIVLRGILHSDDYVRVCFPAKKQHSFHER